MPSPTSLKTNGFNCGCFDLQNPSETNRQIENITLILALSALKKQLKLRNEIDQREIKQLKDQIKKEREEAKNFYDRDFKYLKDTHLQIKELNERTNEQFERIQGMIDKRNKIATVAITVTSIAFFFFLLPCAKFSK